VECHDLCVQKRSCLLWRSDAFWKFSLCKLYKKFLGSFSRFCVQKRSCLSWNSEAFWKLSVYKVCREGSFCFEVHTHFGSSLPVTFTEKVMGACSWFMRPKTKLFAVKFRRILEALRLQDLQKKVLGAISRFVCHANKHFYSWLQHFVKKLWSYFTILHTHKSLLCCSDTLWSSWLSHFIRAHCFESEHIWTMTAPLKLWCAGVTLCEAISKKSWTGTSDMFCSIWTLKEWNYFVKFDRR